MRWPQTLLCVTAGAGLAAALLHPHAFPASWVLRPGRSLRDAAAALAPAPAGRLADQRTTYLVLGRRPLAFYLNLLHHPMHLAEGLAALRQPAPPDTRAILDEALLVQEADTRTAWAGLQQFWTVEAQFSDVLDPVTLLDVDPAAAYESEPKRAYSVWLLTPSRP